MKKTIADALKAQKALEDLLKIHRDHGLQFTGTTMLKIVRAFGVLNKIKVEYDSTKEGLIRKHGKPHASNKDVIEVPQGTPAWKKFLEELQPILQSEVEFTPVQITDDELKLYTEKDGVRVEKECPIPDTVLLVLMETGYLN